MTHSTPKIQSITRELSANGYQVVVDPAPHQLPFSLGGYRPEVVAVKGNEGIVLGVKSSLKGVSVDRLQEIAEQIAARPGWRFVLVTPEDETDSVLPADETKLPSWPELDSRCTKLNTLLRQSLFEPALLFLWSILEAALRKRALAQHLPIARLPANKLLNQIYSSGEISVSEFDVFKDCLGLRNQLAHGLSTAVDPNAVEQATVTLQSLLHKWQDPI